MFQQGVNRLEHGGVCWGRLWAVEGQPGMAGNDQRQPLVCRSAASRRRAPQVADCNDQFLRNKRQEWEDYRRQVTEYERDRYLRVL
jgi:hypothetical protein